MHIPDNYLSVSTCATLVGATVPVWVRAISKVARDFPRERFSSLGVASAFAFLAMMFNVPLPGGTTGHAVGGTLLAVLLGPEPACIALTIALAIQALIFGDGGILAFGANCFNMAFILPYAGYYTYRFLRRLFKSRSDVGEYFALGIASYVGINLSSIFAGVEFGLQPLLFHDASGQALYCPYGLSTALPAMAIGHLTIFGLAEVVFSVFVFAFVKRIAPDFIVNRASISAENREDEKAVSATSRFNALYLLLAVLILLTPLGLLASGTAWGEWGADEIAEVEVDGQTLGYVPEKMLDGFQWSALIPDYSTPGMPEWLSYIFSAVAGVAAIIVLFKLVSVFFRDKAPS